MKAYIRTFSFEGVRFFILIDVRFSFVLIPEKLVNYLLIRGTMGILLRIYVISILLKYTDVQCHIECHL